MFNNKNSNSSYRRPGIFQGSKDDKPKIKMGFIVYVVFVLAVLFFFVYAIFFAPWFRIKNIEIVGNPTEQMKTELNQLLGKNLFAFSCGKIEQNLLSQNRNYQKVKIYRGIPDTIRVYFENRDPKIIWQSGNQKYFVDQSAIIFEEADLDLKLPLVIDINDIKVNIPTQIATSNFVNFVLAADSDLKKNNYEIINFEVNETTFQISAVTGNNIRFLFNTLRPLSEQMDGLNKVYGESRQSIKEYIDLRVEGKVYFK